MDQETPRLTRESLYLSIAEVVAERSTCRRLRVGAALVSPGDGVSIGYNGAPKGMPHCTSETCDPNGGKCLSTVHAETNAILAAARTGMTIVGGHLYCTHSPCENCARMIINSGILRVTFISLYGEEGIKLLISAGIKIGTGKPSDWE